MKWSAIVLLTCATAAQQSTTLEEAPSCVEYKNAKQFLGKDACIVGRVVHVSDSQSGNVYVNFCTDYRNCEFSAVALRKNGGFAGDLHDLEGKVVEFRGNVTSYKGQPEILLTSRDQLRILDDQQKAESRKEAGAKSPTWRRHPRGHAPTGWHTLGHKP
jgi:DNA/RNA endonuclease YhcR with UshA esterase domain